MRLGKERINSTNDWTENPKEEEEERERRTRESQNPREKSHILVLYTLVANTGKRIIYHLKGFLPGASFQVIHVHCAWMTKQIMAFGRLFFDSYLLTFDVLNNNKMLWKMLWMLCLCMDWSWPFPFNMHVRAIPPPPSFQNSNSTPGPTFELWTAEDRLIFLGILKQITTRTSEHGHSFFRVRCELLVLPPPRALSIDITEHCRCPCQRRCVNWMNKHIRVQLY